MKRATVWITVMLMALSAWGAAVSPQHVRAPASKVVPKTTTKPLQKVIEIPFVFRDDMIIIKALVNGKRTGNFMFDTGWGSALAISSEFDVGDPKGESMGISPTGVVVNKTYKVNKLQIGELDVTKSVDVMATQLDWGSGTHKEPIDGIIGLQSWWEYVLEINMKEKKMRFYPREMKDLTKMKADGKSSWLIPIDPTSGTFAIYLPVSIGGKPGKMVLDTGCIGQAFVIFRHAAERWGIYPNKPEFVHGARDVSGTHDTYECYIHDIGIGPIHIDDATASIQGAISSSQEKDGLIGTKFWENYNTWIDFRGRYVFLERWQTEDYIPKEGEIGVLTDFDQITNRLLIFFVIKGSPAEKAGLKRGDMIAAINGTLIQPATYKRCQDALKGKPGEKVRVSLFVGNEIKTYEVERKILVNGTPTPHPAAPPAAQPNVETTTK
ncbi:MAG: aspartyl protease family protein [bacterium]